jgi:hypothetical protein
MRIVEARIFSRFSTAIIKSMLSGNPLSKPPTPTPPSRSSSRRTIVQLW